jgi:simple sugar transport system substrate-binding protein/basic membrane protein A
MRKITLILGLIVVFVFSAYAFNVALMITGEVGGNPIYEMMVTGAKRSGELNGYNVKVVEGGYNASKWEHTM